MLIDDIRQLLNFFHLCEKLKTEKRHGKTSDNENDRVASHSWRIAIMIMFLAPFLDKKIDLLKALKMALIHDLGEIIIGDQAYFHHMFDKEEKAKKELKENEAIERLASYMPDTNKDELTALWAEYNEQESYEAKAVKAIDKLEAHMQHNEADISVWNEHDRKHYKTFLDKFCDFDNTLKTLKILLQEESSQKLKSEFHR